MSGANSPTNLSSMLAFKLTCQALVWSESLRLFTLVFSKDDTSGVTRFLIPYKYRPWVDCSHQACQLRPNATSLLCKKSHWFDKAPRPYRLWSVAVAASETSSTGQKQPFFSRRQISLLNWIPFEMCTLKSLITSSTCNWYAEMCIKRSISKLISNDWYFSTVLTTAPVDISMSFVWRWIYHCLVTHRINEHIDGVIGICKLFQLHIGENAFISRHRITFTIASFYTNIHHILKEIVVTCVGRLMGEISIICKRAVNCLLRNKDKTD